MAPSQNPSLTRLEELALFRHAIVGDLVIADQPRGTINAELRRRAERRYRPPGANASRTYHWKTLQRWLFAARRGLLELQPAARQLGFCLALPSDVRDLLLDIRRQHLSASADLILNAAIQHGVLNEGDISLPSLRRMYARADIPRQSAQRHARAKDRRRWEADRVCRLWHADVCHVWLRGSGGSTRKVYIHGILDDRSRYIVSLVAREAETENDLLEPLVEALARYPRPDTFYVDNGATYRGKTLTLAMGRLDVRVVHAQPYDPQARGKMERFWRTLRQRLLDHTQEPMSLHTLNAALAAWLDTDYHRRAHGGLMGQRPGRCFREGIANLPRPASLRDLAVALQVPKTAKVRNDATFSVHGTLYEVRGRHLNGKTLQLQLDPFTAKVLSVRFDKADVHFGICDAQRNGRRGRGTVKAVVVPAKHHPRFDRISNILKAAREMTHED